MRCFCGHFVRPGFQIMKNRVKMIASSQPNSTLLARDQSIYSQVSGVTKSFKNQGNFQQSSIFENLSYPAHMSASKGNNHNTSNAFYSTSAGTNQFG